MAVKDLTDSGPTKKAKPGAMTPQASGSKAEKPK